MTNKFAISLIAVLMLVAPAVVAQTAPDGAMTRQMDERFQHMRQMMDRAQMAHGEQRMTHMREHMALMQQQMQAMHGMMEQGEGPGAMTGSNMMGGPQMGRMQQRMDMMQRMMEHMLGHQEMMMAPEQ